LLALDRIPGYIRTPFVLFTILIILFGIAELALQNYQHSGWLKRKTAASLFLGIAEVLLFILSSQPYAAAFMFCLLILKGFLLIKRQ